MGQTIEELAKSVNLPNKKTSQIIDRLKKNMLISLYRYNPTVDGDEELTKFNLEMNEKICDVYFKKYGKRFNPNIHSKNKDLPLFLMGPPGQGKTASYLVAGKEVCLDLGLNFIRNVTDNYIPSRKDFIMVVQETAGENSALTFGGVPNAVEIEVNGEKVSVLKKALNYRFTVFERVAGGVLLFDDAANAPQVIQNVLLPVAQNKTFQGLELKNAYVGFTGNLGSLDGTYTTELSSALRTRVVPYFVTDTVKDFVQRAYEQYNDELGDLGIINFLLRNETYFASLPDPNAKGGFPCSRSWDNLIQSVRNVVEINGGRGRGEYSSIEEIHGLAKSLLGPEVGEKLVAYIDSLLQGADPLAKKFIDKNFEEKNNLADKEALMKEFKGKYKDGTSTEAMSFGYQFVSALGDYVTNFVAGDGGPKDDPMQRLEEGMRRFALGALQVRKTEFAFAIDHLKNKLATTITKFSAPERNGTRELTPEIKTIIAHAIAKSPVFRIDHKSVLLGAITDYDKIASVTTTRKKLG